MYTQYYGLQAQPFRLTPDPYFFFNSATHKSALAYMRYGLQQGEGFIVVTGAAGTGKTTLALTLVGGLPRNAMEIGELVTTQLQPEDLLHAIAATFKLDLNGTKSDVIIRLQEFFTRRARAGKHVLLVVDEAHDMPQESFEELRMLSNLHRGPKALLQCILLGQPPLRDMLNRTNMEQFQQRVIAAHHLHPLSLDETRGYILHRLRQAGWRGDPGFTAEAITLVHQYTQGTPRRINALCNRLMLYDYIEGKHTIDAAATMQVYFEWIQELGQVASLEALRQPQLENITIEGITQAHAVLQQAAGAENLVYRAAATAYSNAEAKAKVRPVEAVPSDEQNTAVNPLKKETTLPPLDKKRPVSILPPPETPPQGPQSGRPFDTFFAQQRESYRKLGQYLHPHSKIGWFILPLAALALVITMTLIFSVDDSGTKVIAENAALQPQAQPASAMTAPHPAGTLAVNQTLPLTPLQSEQTIAKETVTLAQDMNDRQPLLTNPNMESGQPTRDTRTEPIPPNAVNAAEAVEAAPPEAKPLPEPVADAIHKIHAPEPAVTGPAVAVVITKPTANLPAKPVDRAKPAKITQQKNVKTEQSQMESTSQLKESMASVSIAYATPQQESSILAVQPIPATKQNTAPINTMPISENELGTLLSRFREAYENGNIQELTALFSSDAHTDEDDNRAAILRSYQKLFNLTNERKMALTNLQWRSEGKAMLGKGQFGVNVKETSRNWKSSYNGTITLTVEKRDGQLLITALNYSYAQ